MANLSRADMALALCDKNQVQPFLSFEDHCAYAVALKHEKYARWSLLLASQLFADLLISWMDEEHRLTVPKMAIEQVVATLTARAAKARDRAQDHLRRRFDAIGVSIPLEELLAELPGVNKWAFCHGFKAMEWGSARMQFETEVREDRGYLKRVELTPDSYVYVKK